MRVSPIEPIHKPFNHLRENPYRWGYCDGLFARKAESPWKDGGLHAMGKNAAYLRGFMAGEKERKKQ